MSRFDGNDIPHYFVSSNHNHQKTSLGILGDMAVAVGAYHNNNPEDSRNHKKTEIFQDGQWTEQLDLPIESGNYIQGYSITAFHDTLYLYGK